MGHPRLFEMAGFDKKSGYEGLTGFAFGLGVERIAMLRYFFWCFCQLRYKSFAEARRSR